MHNQAGPDRRDDRSLVASLRCPCGGGVLEVRYLGRAHKAGGDMVPCTTRIGGRFVFREAVRWLGCLAEHLLFDKDLVITMGKCITIRNRRKSPA